MHPFSIRSDLLMPFATLVLAMSVVVNTPTNAEEYPAAKAEPVVLGYVETVSFGKLDLRMRAKLDTGADTSAVHAYDIERYKRKNGDEWVRFRLFGQNDREIKYDKRVTRNVRIKKKTDGHIRRPVVSFSICVGGVRGEAEVNLADREDFKYPVLIGREFMASRILVDSGKKLTAENECSKADE